MGAVDIGMLFGLAGCLVGAAGWLSGRDKRVSSDAQWRGTVDAKLDLIVGIRSDVAAHERVLSDHGERIKAVESSAAQAHHRIDEINDRILK